MVLLKGEIPHRPHKNRLYLHCSSSKYNIVKQTNTMKLHTQKRFTRINQTNILYLNSLFHHFCRPLKRIYNSDFYYFCTALQFLCVIHNLKLHKGYFRTYLGVCTFFSPRKEFEFDKQTFIYIFYPNAQFLNIFFIYNPLSSMLPEISNAIEAF